MTATLLERRAAEERLKSRDLADFERELDTEVEAERERRARALKQASEAERQVQLKAALVAREQERLDAVGRAEKALREFVAAMRDVLSTGASVREVCRGLGRPVPSAVDSTAYEARLSDRLVAILTGITGHPARFGRLDYGWTWRQAADDWTKGERAELAPSIEALTRQEN